jgi:hypothetical protein
MCLNRFLAECSGQRIGQYFKFRASYPQLNRYGFGFKRESPDLELFSH